MYVQAPVRVCKRHTRAIGATKEPHDGMKPPSERRSTTSLWINAQAARATPTGRQGERPQMRAAARKRHVHVPARLQHQHFQVSAAFGKPETPSSDMAPRARSCRLVRRVQW